MSGHGKLRLLLVEDDPDIAAVAVMALEGVGGFEVTSCGSGPEALAAAPRVRPDLVLLDVMMPGMDGPSTLAGLRKLPELERTPVVFMTARAQKEEIERYLQLGAIGVIAKPFDPMGLSSQVSTLLRATEENR